VRPDSARGFFFFGRGSLAAAFLLYWRGLARRSGADTPVSYVGFLPASLISPFRSAGILPAFCFSL